MALYTFGVYTADVMRAIEAGQLDSDTAPYEELDVDANDAVEARRKAQDEALSLYGEGAELFSMWAGGSGGLVQW